MLTRDRGVATDAPAPSRIWVSAFWLGVIVVAAITSFWWFGDDAVPATQAEPIVTFDGQATSYDGPTLIEKDGIFTFEFVNNSNERAVAVVFRYPSQAALDAHLADFPIGTDIVPEAGASPGSTGLAVALGGPGPVTDTVSTTLAAGYYVWQVATFDTPDQAIPSHVWQVVAFEVVD